METNVLPSQGPLSAASFFDFHNNPRFVPTGDVFKPQVLGLHPLPPPSVTDDELAAMKRVFESRPECRAASVVTVTSPLRGNLAFAERVGSYHSTPTPAPSDVLPSVVPPEITSTTPISLPLHFEPLLSAPGDPANTPTPYPPFPTLVQLPSFWVALLPTSPRPHQ